MNAKKQYLEISSFLVFSLLAVSLSYFFILRETLNTFFLEKENKRILSATLLQKQKIKMENNSVKKTLLQWQQKNPELYQAMQQPTDHLLAGLTTLIQNTGFNIVRIQPVITHNQTNIKNNIVVDVSATGNYFLLFYLMDALDQNPWPIQLSAITVNNKNEFQLSFSLRGRSE